MTITVNPKDEKELEKVKTFLETNEVEFFEENSENDFWNELSDAEKNSIEKGLKDIELGNIVSHEEVMKRFAR